MDYKNIKVYKMKNEGYDFGGYSYSIQMINKNTFDYYIQGSNQRGFAITPQVDRASPKLVNIKWFMNIPSKINSINFKNISKSISKDLGKKYAGHYTLNAFNV